MERKERGGVKDGEERGGDDDKNQDVVRGMKGGRL